METTFEPVAVKNGILAALAAIGSCIVNQLGGWDVALAVLIGMMAADYITGLLLAAVFHASDKTLGGGVSSHASFKGLVRKFLILILVWMGAMLDKVIGAAYIRTAVAMFFIANEGISIIENIVAMGVPCPPFVRKALEALKDKNDKAVDDKATDENAGG